MSHSSFVRDGLVGHTYRCPITRGYKITSEFRQIIWKRDTSPVQQIMCMIEHPLELLHVTYCSGTLFSIWRKFGNNSNLSSMGLTSNSSKALYFPDTSSPGRYFSLGLKVYVSQPLPHFILPLYTVCQCRVPPQSRHLSCCEALHLPQVSGCTCLHQHQVVQEENHLQQ